MKGRRVEGTDATIVDLLKRSDGFISGEQICRELGISRAAVWKQIERLRGLGYRISSSTRVGYRLDESPNRPSALEVGPLLETESFGREFVFLDETDSTNRAALGLAEEGSPEGTVVVADSQTAGRGRLNRQWFSPPGLNLYFSLVLRPSIPPARVPQIALVAGMAVARCLRAISPDLDAGVKWPNDVLLRGKKLCGILCDMRSEMDMVHHVIAGVGVNVNVTRDDFPDAVAGTATSLRIALGREVSRPELLAGLLLQIERAYRLWLESGLEAFRGEWREQSVLRGCRVSVSALNETISGRVVDLASTGALVVEQEDGQRREIVSGDVHVEAYEQAGPFEEKDPDERP